MPNHVTNRLEINADRETVQKVMNLLISAEIIETVKGHGKGKYCFIKKLSEKPDYEGSV